MAKESSKKMAKASGKKRNFTESELEVLLSEVETKKKKIIWNFVLRN